MAGFIKALFGGSKHDRDMKRLLPIVEEVKKEYPWAESLSDDDFPKITEAWKEEVRNGRSLDSLLPKAFALAREAAWRTLGERHYDVQIMGAIVLHQGSILEMKTGEGKTLTSVPAAYLNALEGRGVHIITVNDYLAERDSQWMGRVFSFLGLTVGVVLAGEDEERKKKAYSADITYGTNNEMGFDYLRDNMKISIDKKVRKESHYAIVDEIDSILIDEARTPLIISGKSEDDSPKVRNAKNAVPYLRECEKDPETGDYFELGAMEKFDRAAAEAFDERGDFKLDEKSKKVTFTKQGMAHMEEALRNLGALLPSEDEEGNEVYSLYCDENFEMVHYVTQAVRARYLYSRDTDYIVKDGEILIVDEFTGRILPGRRYSEGLHQAIEAKEGVNIRSQSKTFATVTFQNFFRMYDKLSGMTGTADTEALEFREIYGMDTVVIPTNVPVIREDLPDLTYYDEKSKYNAIVRDVIKIHATGQPILIGTTSIEKSEKLSALLTRSAIRHEVLNAKNHAREAFIIGEAGRKGAVTIATNMAGRGTDIKLGGSLRHMAMGKVGSKASEEEIEKAMSEMKDEYLKAYEEVKELGGLYIIGSERHESRRIDNQLRGRSGRQGDPGKSRFYIALDDTLMRLFAKEGVREIIGKLGLKDGAEIQHRMLDNAIEKAQVRVEERNFEIRKHLLEYDDVLNEQRNYIYSERDRILTDEDISKTFIEAAVSYIEESEPEEIKTILPSLDSSEITKEEVISVVRKNISDKESLIGRTELNNFIRYVYLRNIDKEWVDHLDVLENLKDAAHLMSYAQKNPLVEYKNTASDAFSDMIRHIEETVLRTVLNVRISIRPINRQSRESKTVDARRRETVLSGESTDKSTTVVREGRKIGRNDPCPCGSGKKYKNCCGKKY